MLPGFLAFAAGAPNSAAPLRPRPPTLAYPRKSPSDDKEALELAGISERGPAGGFRIRVSSLKRFKRQMRPRSGGARERKRLNFPRAVNFPSCMPPKVTCRLGPFTKPCFRVVHRRKRPKPVHLLKAWRPTGLSSFASPSDRLTAPSTQGS